MLLIIMLASLSTLVAQEKQAEHLLDGTSMKYYYQTGTAIHLELYDGKLNYK